MPKAHDLRAKARKYLDLAEQNGGWQAVALKELAADYILDAEKLEVDGEAGLNSDSTE